MGNSYTAVASESVFEQILIWIKGNDSKIRYLPDGKDGWINVRFVSGKNRGVEWSVPQGLKVRLDRTESKRDYYTFLEGWDLGCRSSLKNHTVTPRILDSYFH